MVKGQLMKKKIASIIALTFLFGTSAFLIMDAEEEKDAQNLSLFSSVFKMLKTEFVDTLNSDFLIRRAIDGMVKSVDPHTVFYNKEETMEHSRAWQGIAYSGIGTRVAVRDSTVIITYPIEGFGAHKSDLRAGDIFLEINGHNVKGVSIDSITKLLKGSPETVVNITVERPYVGTIKKEVTRKQIINASIPFYTLLDTASGIGYIQVQQFLADSDNQFTNAVKELKKNPRLKSIILDLRDNIGGLVEEAVNCVNVFVPKNTVVIHVKGKATDYNNITHNEPVDTLLPLVILTNSNTISAGEIFTGAMQDLDRAVIIGQKTFGKGLVQGTRFPGYGTSLYVTAARYYTPSGRCIQKRDYSKRYINGTETIYADTLKRAFYTRNGRKVYDIGGIEPDINTPSTQSSNPIIDALSKQYLFFDYATYFRNTNQITTPAHKITVTDSIFNDFLKFAAKKNYSFLLPEEEKLKELGVVLKKDNTEHLFAKQYNAFYRHLRKQKKAILLQNKEQIKQTLQKEIVGRYHSYTGVLKNSLPHDSEISKAKEILNSSEKYKAVLNAKR